jgi:hypothetical protein
MRDNGPLTLSMLFKYLRSGHVYPPFLSFWDMEMKSGQWSDNSIQPGQSYAITE